MSQPKVTQFFVNRKKTFDVIQPSKKLKLDVDELSEIKVNVKSINRVKLQPCVPASSKRVPVRKRKQGAIEGNISIKSFLETSARYKLPKTCTEESTHGKALTDAKVWCSGTKREPEISADCDKDIKNESTVNSVQKVKVKLDFTEQNTPPLQRMKRQPVKLTETNVMAVLESTVVSGASKLSKSKPQSPEVTVVQKSSNSLQQQKQAAINVGSNSSIPNNETTASCIDNKIQLCEQQPADCELDKHSKPGALQTEMKITKDKDTSPIDHSFQEIIKNQLVGKPPGPTPEEKNVPKDKHASLKEKIKHFKEAMRHVKAPDKVETNNEPCYQRFHSISQKDVDTSLVLPLKYKLLNEMFRSTETVVSMLYNRKEVCTFDKLKQSVQQLTNRVFDKNILGQIATVYPEAYTFQLEKGFCTLSSTVKSNRSQLTITPMLASKPSDAQSNEKSRMNPSTLLKRRENFNGNLVDMTKKHHGEFLVNLNPPIHVPADKVRRWHPKFLVDDVPDVPVFPLPESTKQKVSTAKDVLEKMNGIVCGRIEKALQKVANEKPSVSVLTKPQSQRVASGPLKGISQALLDKIRNKENAKIARDMLRKPESEKHLEMLYRLPELVRILRTYFVVEKRAAIALEDVKVKLCDSFRSPISPDDVEQHLKLLCPIVPKWLTYVTIPRGVFVKIDKNVDLQDIIKAIDAEIAKEKS